MLQDCSKNSGKHLGPGPHTVAGGMVASQLCQAASAIPREAVPSGSWRAGGWQRPTTKLWGRGGERATRPRNTVVWALLVGKTGFHQGVHSRLWAAYKTSGVETGAFGQQ